MLNIRQLLILVLFLPTLASGSTKYVSDHLRVLLREEAGSGQNVKLLHSGDKVELLEQGDSDYSHVRTEDGKEGWIKSRYLVDEPTHSIKLERAQKKIDALNKRIASLKETVKGTSGEKSDLEKELASLRQQNASSQKEIERLSSVATLPKQQLVDDNKSLREKNVLLTEELNMLKAEKQAHQDREKRNWFLAGAGVIIFGMFLGLMIPKIRIGRKSGWEY